MSNSLKQIMRETYQEAVQEAQEHFERVIAQHLTPGEQVLGYRMGENRPPFLLRIIPVVSELLKTRKYLLVITNRRVLLLKLSHRAGKSGFSDVESVLDSLPFNEISAVEPKTGLLTSKLVLRTRGGKKYRFTDMLKSAAQGFADDLAYVRAGAGA